MRQFSAHPTIDYVLNGKRVRATNFFIHLTLRDILKNNSNFLASYDLSAEERPDIVAEKVYGNSDLAWLVLMTNDIVDPTEEWVKNTTNFQSYLNSKYSTAKDLYATNYSTYNSNVADYDASDILQNNNSPFGTVLSKKDSNATNPTKYKTITNASVEDTLNEGRRTIKIIKKDFLQAVLTEISTKLKEGE